MREIARVKGAEYPDGIGTRLRFLLGGHGTEMEVRMKAIIVDSPSIDDFNNLCGQLADSVGGCLFLFGVEARIFHGSPLQNALPDDHRTETTTTLPQGAEFKSDTVSDLITELTAGCRSSTAI